MNERSIFMEALDFDEPRERSAYILHACGDDEPLRARVEALLRRHQSDDELVLDRMPAVDPSETEDMPRSAEEPGNSIGPYKLREQIGEGGMGVVYVAEQAHPVRRKVALKIIKPGMDSRQVVARFEAERQALAMMDHPNIARVFDGGTTPSGRPYFVMELVRGIPITDYCDRERLSIPERLELFVLVCRAVQHAHQKGIIHRDLKPSNILVTLIDGAAVPKVIDFGVAKATGASLTDRTVYTAFHQFVGTPLYVSPEQADLSSMDVDTRSDIYSLGVMLYELLTGTTPFDQETLRKATFDELRRIIHEQDPPKPSTRLSSLGATRTTVSANRKADARHLDRTVRGELDWIVMKALEKDRRHRYETANDFAADVMRYLTDRPVEACPPSPWYRFSKYTRRHRAALTTAALVGIALVAGTAVSVWQAARAARAAGEARQRAEESRQVVEYLAKDIFGAAAPGKKSSRSVTVGELLDRADATLGDRFRRQPLVEANVRMALAQSYREILDNSRAEQNAARAAQIRERYYGPEHPETLEALALQVWSILCSNIYDLEKTGRAEPIARRVLAARRRVLGPAHADTIRSQADLGLILGYRGGLDEAETLLVEAEALGTLALGAEHESTLYARHFLGLVLGMFPRMQGDPARAEALLRQVQESHERIYGPLSPATLTLLMHRAEVVRPQGRPDEARRLQLETVNRYAQAFGLSHIQTSPQISRLFSLLEEQCDYAAIRDLCEGWIRELLAMPPEPDKYERNRRSVRLSGLALTLAMLPEPIPFDVALAAGAAEQAAALDGDWDDAWTVVGVVYYRTGQIVKAMQAIQTSISRPRWKGGDDFDWLMLALIHTRRGEFDQARAWYEKARNRPNPVDFNRDDLRPLREEAEALLGAPNAPRPEGDRPSKTKDKNDGTTGASKAHLSDRGRRGPR